MILVKNVHFAATFRNRQRVNATRNKAIRSTCVTVASSTIGTTTLRSVKISASLPRRSRAANRDDSRRRSSTLKNLFESHNSAKINLSDKNLKINLQKILFGKKRQYQHNLTQNQIWVIIITTYVSL